MTNAPIFQEAPERLEDRIPPRDTTGHFVLHSLIRHSDLRDTDWRSISEIATSGQFPSRAVVANELADLLDSGVVVTATKGGETGYRVLTKCACAPPRLPKKSLVTDIFDSQQQNRLTRALAPGETPVWREANEKDPAHCGQEAQLPDSVPLANGGVCLVGNRLVRAPGRAAPPDSPWGLVRYFSERLAMAHSSFDQAVDPTNFKAMISKFSAWMNHDGVTPQEIRNAIDFFTSTPYTGKVSPWKKFITDRQHLIEAGRRIARDREKEAHRLDRSWWEAEPEKPKLDLEEMRRRAYADLPKRDREEYERFMNPPDPAA